MEDEVRSMAFFTVYQYIIECHAECADTILCYRKCMRLTQGALNTEPVSILICKYVSIVICYTSLSNVFCLETVM